MRIIAGEARGRRIEAPTGRNTRPTLDRVRENLFNMLQGEIPGSRVLDLFAGSGALSFEALSRGATFACLTDCDKKAVETEKRNADTLGFTERVSIVQADWHRGLQIHAGAGKRFDLVFLDPPYAMTDLRDVFSGVKEVLEEDGIVVLEHEADRTPETGEDFEILKKRSWGFCGVTLLRRKQTKE